MARSSTLDNLHRVSKRVRESIALKSVKGLLRADMLPDRARHAERFSSLARPIVKSIVARNVLKLAALNRDALDMMLLAKNVAKCSMPQNIGLNRA